MPEVTIEQSTFERLQQHARPLIDTTDSVIVRALDALDERGGSSARADQVLKLPPRNQPLGALAFGPNMSLPDVRHTRMLAASIDGEPVGANCNWANVLRLMLIRATEHFGHFEELRRRCAVNIVPGVKDDDGYSHLPRAGISYQGVNANAAANAIVTLAKDIGTALDVHFEWRDKDQAAHPGRRGRIHVPARSQAASHDA